MYLLLIIQRIEEVIFLFLSLFFNWRIIFRLCITFLNFSPNQWAVINFNSKFSLFDKEDFIIINLYCHLLLCF